MRKGRGSVPPLYRYLVRPLLSAALRVAALRSPKGRRGVAGRREWRSRFSAIPSGDPPLRVHVHAASVGEFEQAKPLIEALRGREPGALITASFFSSSGVEQQGAYPFVDAAGYLPRDLPGEMSDFLDALAPDLIIVIRYDLWPELLAQARRRSIPVVLACGVLRSDSSRFNPLARPFFAWLYGELSLICAVGDDDRAAFQRLAPDVPVVVCGDTRYDRVAGRARAASRSGTSLWKRMREQGPLLIAGSSWTPDEELLAAIGAGVSLVVVPHEPGEEHVKESLRRFPGSVRFSAIDRPDADMVKVPTTVILDRTGMLSGLYAEGDIAYVGGAFGEGVHSVLEPAVFGIPVFCGPRIERSRDASEMYREGVLTVVRNREELVEGVGRLVADPAGRKRRGEEARRFVAAREGGTEKVLAAIESRGLLRNGASKALSLPS